MRLYVAYLATDGGADAVALGVRLARTLSAQLDIGMVLPPDRSAVLHSGDYEDMLTAQATEWLSAAAALVPDDVEVATHIAFHESSAEGIIAEAQRVGAAAIMVGGSGGGLVGGHSLGSVVTELVHSAPLPVALAPRGLRRSKVKTVREITCALGTRAGADALFDTAVEASRRAHIPLRVVSLVALDRVGPQRGTPEAVLAAATGHARSHLDAARTHLPEGVTVTWDVVDGPTVEDAVDKLEWNDGDVIMVGSSRLAAPRRLFLGSTAAKMLRVLQVPMVVVPKSDD
ncbi:universal stress protein UspA [Gordonia spumicola]|uniref:Universal stress protein UspA n=1 Tax=Gordonia spumicola TaxID=589161 RepID=A0A7I9V9S6_9ACTN|nr:universal stress protein [Gordonia spumicola]GEE02146.1 universal stress protein UspA [Gordonia spumicola]